MQTWTKSSYSSGANANRVEFRVDVGHIQMRDSKNPDSARLAVPPREWQAFLVELGNS